MPGIQKHAIPFPGRIDVMFLDHRPDVLVRDYSGVARVHFFRDRQLSASKGHRIEQHTTAHKTYLRHVFDTQRPQTKSTDFRVFQIPAIVEEHAFGSVHTDMTRAIYLSVDLPDRRPADRHVYAQRVARVDAGAWLYPLSGEGPGEWHGLPQGPPRKRAVLELHAIRYCLQTQTRRPQCRTFT